ncbi:MAG: hypothetical protein A2V88_08655 [Elusimicrobia bacterium RBG_16_66_12]|nr:MAG: hypothetical protein A2V88_08655 [Elusimicrobia bacterium RBG_16_66_12]
MRMEGGSTVTDWQPTSIGHKPPPPPDAGASFMGVYGLGNPWVLWLLRKQAELLALTPEQLRRDLVPVCPDSRGWKPHRMMLRPEGWVCYRHPKWMEGRMIESPVRVLFEPRLQRAPKGDVLTRVKEALDVVYDDGEWRVRPLDL